MIITRPAHKISKYAGDFRGQLVVSRYDHTLPVNISAQKKAVDVTSSANVSANLVIFPVLLASL
jgi:hypothetical protein